MYSDVNRWISVVIRPFEMEELQRNLLCKVLDKVCGKCMDGVGYVEDVLRIVKVQDNFVSPRSGSGNFNVLCTLQVIQVQEGDIIDAKVSTLIHDKGLYADREPITIFAKWHREMTNVYEGNTCKFKILRYRLEDDSIICIGEYMSDKSVFSDLEDAEVDEGGAEKSESEMSDE